MRLLIYGASDFAVTVIELVRACGHEPVGFVDDFKKTSETLGSLSEVMISHPPSDYGLAFAIGYKDLNARQAAWAKTKSAGYTSPALIHPRAYVAASANIGFGTMVMAGAIVDGRVSLGEAVVLWPGACINHDSRIDSNCFISPNAIVCGFAHIGEGSFIGAGAAVAERVDVPAGSFIKMLSRYPKSVA